MKYQAGDLTYYESDDPIFDTREEAEAYIVRHFRYLDSPGALSTDWKNGGELLAIYYMDEWYTKRPTSPPPNSNRPT